MIKLSPMYAIAYCFVLLFYVIQGYRRSLKLCKNNNDRTVGGLSQRANYAFQIKFKSTDQNN